MIPKGYHLWKVYREALGYAATVEAYQSLPPEEHDAWVAVELAAIC